MDPSAGTACAPPLQDLASHPDSCAEVDFAVFGCTSGVQPASAQGDLSHFICGNVIRTRAWSDSWLCGCLLSAFSQLEEEDRREELNRKEYAALCLRDADCTDMPLFSPSLPKMNKSSTDIPSVKKLMSSSGCVDAVRCCFCDNSWLFL